jgi:hypothetical protein
MNTKKHHIQITAILFLVGLIPSVSQAELGSNIASVMAEQKGFNSQLTTSNQNGATVYTLTLPSGTVIQEYASANGVIFALSWSGPELPNLQAILGNHFKDYLTGIKQSRGAFSINTESIAIQSAGMMGAFQGFALLPKQAPVGFTIQNLAQ